MRNNRLLEKTKQPAIPAERTTATLDVSKYIRFAPPFQEKEVDKYFLHFEKIATSLELAPDVGMLLLHSVLVGKPVTFILQCQFTV